MVKEVNKRSRFKLDNGCYLECNQKAQLSSNAASQWLALRLQLIGVTMLTSVAFLAVLQHHLDFADAGTILKFPVLNIQKKNYIFYKFKNKLFLNLPIYVIMFLSTL